MKDDILDFKSEKLFPFQFQLFGVAIAFMGLICLAFMPWISPILLLLAVLIFTSRRGIEFDNNGKSYRVYNSFLFWKTGKPTSYEAFERIYIHHSNVSQKVYTMYTASITSRSLEYDAYLKLEDGSRLYLMSHKNKDKLLKRLQPLTQFLNLHIAQ